MHGNRIARITAGRAVVPAACIGILGSVAALSTSHEIFLPIVASLAFGGFIMTYVLARGRMWREVVRFVSAKNAPVGGFENMALAYLGYTVRHVSDRVSIVDGDVLVYVTSSVDMADIRNALDMAAEKRAKSVIMALRRFGTNHVTKNAAGIMEVHGIGLLDLNGLFGACHAKMAADWRRDADAA